jgi:hypothetical protein
MVDRLSDGLNIPCDCESRRKVLNNLVPYDKKFKLGRNGK